MSVKDALSINRKSITKVLKEIKHYAQVLAVALTIGASQEIGLPNFAYTDGRISVEIDAQRFLGSVILVIGILALSEWLRRPTNKR